MNVRREANSSHTVLVGRAYKININPVSAQAARRLEAYIMWLKYRHMLLYIETCGAHALTVTRPGDWTYVLTRP